jgi:hypothetical protein
MPWALREFLEMTLPGEWFVPDQKQNASKRLPKWPNENVLRLIMNAEKEIVDRYNYFC